MRSLPFPRRLQLVKLLRAHGLRDVERLREDELKEALARLSILLPDQQGAFAPAPSTTPPSSAMGGARSGPAPDPDDDDPHALPRFREPRAFLPDHERTFFRLVAVKPRQLFLTWDLHKDIARDRPTWVQIMVADFLGDPPSRDALAAQHPSYTVDVDARAAGWYVSIPGERCAVVAALIVDGVRVAVSNLALTPPARPAPPGPLWEATLQPGTSRRALRHGGLLKDKLPKGAVVVVKGEAGRVEDITVTEAIVESGVDASGSGQWMRTRIADQRADANPSSSSSLSMSSGLSGRTNA